jgi:hypothetical protein
MLRKQRQQGFESQQIFKGSKAFLGSSTNPSLDVLTALFESTGGEIVQSIESAELLLFGGNDDALEWVNTTEKEIKKDKTPNQNKLKEKVDLLESAHKLAGGKKAFTFRYICDCIEEGKKLKADAKSNHLIILKGSNILPRANGKNVEKKGVYGEKEEEMEALNGIDPKLTFNNDKKIAAEKKDKEMKDKREKDGDLIKGVKVDKRKKKVVETGVTVEDERISLKGRKRGQGEINDVEVEQGGEVRHTKEVDNARKKVDSIGSSNSSRSRGKSPTLVDDSTFDFAIERSPADKRPPIKAGRLTRKSIISSASPSLSQPSPKKIGNTQDEVAGILITELPGKVSRKRPILTEDISGSREKKGKENSNGNKEINESRNKLSKSSSIYDESKLILVSSSKREVAENDDDDEDGDEENDDTSNASPNW